MSRFMPAYGESARLTISIVSFANSVIPPSSSTPRMMPRAPAYSAPRLSVSAAMAIACSSVAPAGMEPPNTRTCVAPIFCATSTHLRRSTSSFSRSSAVGCASRTRVPML